MNYIITEEELTSLEKTGNPSYRKSVEYVIGRIRSRPVMSDLEDAITKQIDYANGMHGMACRNEFQSDKPADRPEGEFVKPLSEDLQFWRADRPDEWTMDRFINSAKALESKYGSLRSLIGEVVETINEIIKLAKGE